ncbi:MAG: HNH endonuclease [Chloroflexota bacterium]|nr:MAG: HNH endonuclease [Chloroflexota bacterium]
MSYIPKAIREAVFERAQGLCEYCQTAKIVVATIEIDHIIPASEGGLTTLDNLCLSCRSCNNSKQGYITGIDPATKTEVSLFNPRTDSWHEHFEWSEDGLTIIGLTETGRATIHRLDMNKKNLVESRQLWVSVGWHPPKQGKFPLK